MRKLSCIVLSLLFLLFLSVHVFATRYIYQNDATDQKGNAIAGATVSVYLAGTSTEADVYSAISGGSAVPSVLSDSSGHFKFFIDDSDYSPGQRFDIVISKSGYNSINWDYLTILPSNFTSIAAYGANVDISDNTDAIQNAIDSGNPVFIPTGIYDFSNKLLNPNTIPIFGPGILNFTGSGEDAIVFGADDESAHQYPNEIETVIRLTRDSKDWTDQYAGIKLINVYGMRAHFYVDSFYIGIQIQGATNSGSLYNTFSLGRLRNNQIGLQLYAEDGSVNQNIFIGGRFNTQSSTNFAGDIHGVQFKRDSGTSINVNNFYNPSFELSNLNGSYIASAFDGAGIATDDIAVYNHIFGMRYEMNSANNFLLTGKDIHKNIFEINFQNPAISESTDLISGDDDAETLLLASNIFKMYYNARPDMEKVKIAEFGRGGMVQLNSDDSITAPARGLWWSADTVSTTQDADLQTGYFVVDNTANIVGMKFNLGDESKIQNRKITIRVISPTGNGGRIAVVLYDSNPTQLTDSDDIIENLTYWATGDYYRTGADGGILNTLEITFSEDVDTAIIGVSKGTSNAEISKIEYLIPGSSKIQLVFDETNSFGIDSDLPMAPSIPKTPAGGNSYPTGQFVMSTDIASGSSKPIGWYYTGSGWVAGPVIP